jgi:two-component system nitrate/nitrite response regulator NarL
MITLAIAEDHQALADGINLLLKYEKSISIVGMCNDGEELIEIVRLCKPDIVLTDIKMPKIDGISATKIIKKELPDTKIIAFSMFDQEEAIMQMVHAGAAGYLLKNSPLEEVLIALERVAKGETYFDASIDTSFLKNNNSNSKVKPLLSKSERNILALIGQGKTSSEIASIRFTAISTVEKHRQNMIHKLGLSGKGELLRYAMQKKYDF